MVKTKFVLLASTLNSTEQKNFTKYLSCFYEKRKRERGVFDYIAKYINSNMHDKKLNRTIAISKHFVKLGIKEESDLLGNVLSNLNTYLEEFLIWQKVKSKKGDFEQENILLTIYQERQLYRLYEIRFQKLHRQVLKENQNTWNFLNRFNLGYSNYFSTSNDKQSIKKTSLDSLIENLDNFFISASLRLACEQAFREKIIGKKIKIEFLDNILQLVNQKKIYNENPLINIYKLFLDIINQPNHEKYQKVKTLITKYYQYETPNEQSICYGFLMNYVAGELKNGKNEYIEEMKFCVKFGLEKKLVFVGGYITPSVFNNLVYTACRIGDFNLGEGIITQYGNALKKNEQVDTLLIAQALIGIEKKDFDSVIQHLDIKRIGHRILNLRARLIMIRAFAGIKDFDKLDNLLKASYQSIKRTKDFSVENKKSALNTFKFVEKIVKLNANLEKLKKEIIETKNIFGKTWLLELIEEMRRI